MGAVAAVAFAAQGVNTYMAGKGAAKAAKSQAAYESQQLGFNARVAEIQAADALFRGTKDAQRLQVQTKKLVGSQRAALAAQGIAVDEDSGADIQEDTRKSSTLDVLTIRNNAWREALGHRVQAVAARGQARLTMLAGKNQARASLLAGKIGMLGSFGSAAMAGAGAGGKAAPATPKAT